jgi:hypothetical protein
MSSDLTIRVGGSGDDDELLNLTHDLRLELLELDIEAVRPRPAPPAPEAPGPGRPSGNLVVSLDPGPSLNSVVTAVRAWAGRNQCDVEVSLGGDILQLSGASGTQRDQHVEAWLAQRSPPA